MKRNISAFCMAVIISLVLAGQAQASDNFGFKVAFGECCS